ncbi:DUF4134 domain-containing protein [Algoriphagus lacus]|uniref:DUF4134 domain-containing protein n=1 Tax=Algoriphagus lacus TaxID=2056311 RepID=A0A418PM93_9BACT|nr:DUF4134 domain-containing protein [Algoriphagus lacus]RIW12104.1 DUF4134 domain-containing protein [Algoriphagus lacus]
MKKHFIKLGQGLFSLGLILFSVTLAYGFQGQVQGNGIAGINSATQQVNGFFASGVSLMYAIGAIVGLVGAVKVFNKWNSGDPDTGKVAAAWFGSCVFLVVVALVLQSFFGSTP